MLLSLFISRKYFISKKSRSVNFISTIAVVSIAISTAAMIIILSVMNGMSAFVESSYSRIAPDLKIEYVQGKFFDSTMLPLRQLEQIEGVGKVVNVLEDQILLQYKDQSRLVFLKGLSSNYQSVIESDSLIYAGNLLLSLEQSPQLALGSDLAAGLQIPVQTNEPTLTLYALQKGALSPLNYTESFQAFTFYPSAVFLSQSEYDQTHVFTSLWNARTIFDESEALSALEVYLQPSASASKIQSQIQQLVGVDFKVKNKQQQQAFLHQSIQSEKLMVMGIFAFILLVSTFTMAASLFLLIYEKQKDIKILLGLGLGLRKLKIIFLNIGLFISWLGAFLGLCLGGLISYGQQCSGWVKLGGGGENYLLDSYPIKICTADFFIVFFIVILVGFLASLFPLFFISDKQQKK